MNKNYITLSIGHTRLGVEFSGLRLGSDSGFDSDSGSLNSDSEYIGLGLGSDSDLVDSARTRFCGLGLGGHWSRTKRFNHIDETLIKPGK